MDESELERIHGLWDVLAKAPAAEVDRSARHLIETISGWIGADHAAWIGTVRLLEGPAARRDALSGWRTRTIVYHPPPTEDEVRKARQIMQKGQSHEPGMTSIATSSQAGRFRVHRLRDGFVDFETFVQTEHYKAYYEMLGVKDRLWVGAPVSDDAEVFFVFDRRANDAPFTAEDAERAGYALRGLTWFHRQLMFSHGVPLANSPLTATERAVMLMLLTDKTEREIAAELGQSPHTTHDHVKEIYRKLGVNGRTGLMAVWLAKF
jgi:DNA-binding CsgD family transcriptional regulator